MNVFPAESFPKPIDRPKLPDEIDFSHDSFRNRQKPADRQAPTRSIHRPTSPTTLSRNTVEQKAVPCRSAILSGHRLDFLHDGSEKTLLTPTLFGGMP